MPVPDIGPLRHYPELDGKTFLLGVGGMRCASSWVFEYLSGLPGVVPSDIKELHFFNTRLRKPGYEPFTQRLATILQDFLDRSGDVAEEIRLNPAFQATVDGLRMLHDDNAYFDYFARICGPQTKVLSEVTPQYAVLGQEGFAFIRDFFASQKITLKIFLILRDPVERLWSHLRLMQEREQVGNILTEWPDLIRQRSVIERCDYWQSIEGLDAIFSAEDVLYLFYEDLFQGDALQQLCAFAGLEFQPPDTVARRNEASVKTALPDEARQTLLRVLKPQYQYCRKRFGDNVPEKWAD